MNNSKNILICPLDWGLGHTTRCIPIIRYLLETNYTVFVACTKNQRQILSAEFSSLQYLDLFGYEIHYSARINFAFKMSLQIPKLIGKIKKENKQINVWIEQYKIDLIISDNRYGCYSTKIPSIFITHQTQIKAPLFSSIINQINHRYISKYVQCWIPDNDQHELSGELSNTDKMSNVHFIGSLSRFQKTNAANKKYDVLFLLSGVEPQRSLLENKIIEQIKNNSLHYFLVRGIQNSNNKISIPEKNYANFLNANELQHTIEESDLVICRSGYSSIMDLQQLQKKVFFIPTPGQTEQEYLADHLKKMKIAAYSSQSDFVIEKAISESKNYSGFTQQSTIQHQKEIILNLIASLF